MGILSALNENRRIQPAFQKVCLYSIAQELYSISQPPANSAPKSMLAPVRALYYFLLIAVFSFSLSPRLQAQTEPQDPDLLRTQLASAKEDTQKVILLAQLANSLFQSDPNAAMKYCQEGELLSEKLGFERGLGEIYLSMGNVYYIRGDQPRQLDYYLKSLKIREKIGDRLGIGHCYNNLGNFYLEKGDLDKAQENFERSLTIRKEIGQKNSIAASLNNLGNVYLQKEDYENAIEYYNQALLLNEETGNKHSAAIALGNIGLIYSRQEKPDKALEYYYRSLELRTELNQKSGIALLHNRIGQIFQKEEDYAKAIKEYEIAARIAEEIGSKSNQETSFGGLADCHAKLGQYSTSVTYYKNFIAIKDSIYNSETANAIAEMEAKYKNELAEREKEKLQADNQLREARQNEKYARIKVLTFGVIGALILILVLVAFLLNQYRQKRKANLLLEEEVAKRTQELTHSNLRLEAEVRERIKTGQDLAQTNEELNTFIYKSSHDIKSPLTTIRGLVEIALAETDSQSPVKQYLELVSERIDHLNLILERLIQNVRMKEGKVEPERVNLKLLLDEVLAKVGSMDGAATVNMKLEFNGIEEFETDKAFLTNILQNLISNSIIFRQQNGSEAPWCRVSFRMENSDQLGITVSDNGIGIPTKILNKVFDMFYRGSLASRGTGLGLYIVRNLVKKLGGEAVIQSEEGQGTTVTVVIPAGTQLDFPAEA